MALFTSLIDDGKNPDEFTRDVINSCVARNQVTKGKTDAFKVIPLSLLILELGYVYSLLLIFFFVNRI